MELREQIQLMTPEQLKEELARENLRIMGANELREKIRTRASSVFVICLVLLAMTNAFPKTVFLGWPLITICGGSLLLFQFSAPKKLHLERCAEEDEYDRETWVLKSRVALFEAISERTKQQEIARRADREHFD